MGVEMDRVRGESCSRAWSQSFGGLDIGGGSVGFGFLGLEGAEVRGHRSPHRAEVAV